MAKRAFSPKCGKCRQTTMALASVPYDIQIDHDGRKYQVQIPSLSVPKCSACGSVSIDDVADGIIDAAFRKKANRLCPEENRQGRLQSGYSNQQDFAEVLGVAGATVSRWETGAQIQQRFHDGVLRAFFEIPELRRFMEKLHGIKKGERDNMPASVLECRQRNRSLLG